MRRGLVSVVLGLLLLAPGVTRSWTMAPHPRLYNPWGTAWQDSLIARCKDTGGNTGSHAYWYTTLKTWIDIQKASNRTTSWIAPLAAMVATVENTQTYKDYAILILTDNATNNASAFWDEDSYSPGCVPGPVIGYDWMYNYMTQQQRDLVGFVIGDRLQAIDPETGRRLGLEHIDREPWLPKYVNLEAIIAVYGDGDGEVAYLPDEVNMFVRMRDKTTYTDHARPALTGQYQGFLDALDEVAANGAINGYAGLRYGAEIMAVEALRSSVGTAYADTSSFLANIGAFWQHRVRSDNVMFSNIGKSNPTGQYVPLYAAWAGSRYGDASANGLARALLIPSNQGELGSYVAGPLVWNYQSIPWIILWYERWRTHQPYPAATTFHDQSAGMVLARDRWFRPPVPYSAASDTTTVAHLGIYCGPNQSNQSVFGHVYFSLGRDAILNGANGYADTDVDHHFQMYGKQSIAYNTLTILKPGEDLGAVYDAVGCGTAYPEIPEEGQQSDRGNACMAEAVAHLPKSDGTFGWGGEIEDFSDSDSVLYVLMDLTSSFKYQCNVTKASAVEREVIWVKPRSQDVHPSIIVVRDVVTRLSSTYRVQQRWHTIHRPDLGASGCACIARLGSPWSSEVGGVYEAIGTRRLKVTRRYSEAQMLVVLPRPGEGSLRIVGGPNVNDDPWKQSQEPSCGNYDATHTSYEFWADGVNYVGAGASKDRRIIPGQEASDWTIEVEAPATGTAVELLTVFVIGESGMNTASARIEPVPGRAARRVVVTQGTSVTDIDFETAGHFSGATRRR